jgi:hypothetical protein
MTSWKDKLALTAQRNRQEIVKAKLDRREMMRLGLLTAGGALIAKAGLSSRAFGQAAPSLTDKDATLSRVPASPPMRPWVAPMPRLVLKKPVGYHDMTAGLPDRLPARSSSTRATAPRRSTARPNASNINITRSARAAIRSTSAGTPGSTNLR